MVRPRSSAAAARPKVRAFRATAAALVEAGRSFYARGWALGTSGNFSAVLRRDPLRLAITASGVDKGSLSPAHILAIDHNGRVLRGRGKPSAEALLHLVIAEARGAGAVLHTHSVWSTLLSSACAAQGGVPVEGYEMLKGLAGVATHEHRAWLPVLENSQDIPALARRVEAALRENPQAHGFLLRGHGLYTWGRNLAEARRHIEILEFLLEVAGRRRTGSAHERSASAGGAD